jgi:RHS repeat-associated protein
MTATGNLLTRSEATATYTLAYDAENRLTQVSNGVTASYTLRQTQGRLYDGDGVRVKAVVGATTSVYVGAYYEVTGGVVKKYYYAGGVRVAENNGGTLYFLLTDHLGSIATTTDANGNRVTELRYLPFGDTRYNPGGQITTYRFTGQRWDPGTGLYWYNSRWYDPLIGRFIQADTIVPQPGNPQSLNRYAYVLNNPLRYTDPTGHVYCQEDPYGELGPCMDDSGAGSSPGPVPIPVSTPPQGTPTPEQIAANQPGAATPWSWGAMFAPDTVVTLYEGVEGASDYAVGYVNAAEGYAIYKVLGKDGKEYWVAAGSAAALRKIGLNPGVANSPAAMKAIRAAGRGGDFIFFLAGGAASVGPNLVAHAGRGDFWSWETATDLIVDAGGWLVSDVGGALIGGGVQVAVPWAPGGAAIAGEVGASVGLSLAWDNWIAPGARAWVRYHLPH